MAGGRVIVVAFLLMILSGATLAEPVEPGAVRVIDRDTVAVATVTYRLVGFAPETGDRAQCSNEAALGNRAALRLRSIVLSGRLDLAQVRCSCRSGTEGTRACNYGRRWAVLKSQGRDVAAIMIAEGLARSYVCGFDRCPPREGWCR